MAHLPPPQKRGPYKLPERMRTMQDIRDLILRGYNYEQIMQQLQIPRRTFYRYLNATFEDDRRLLSAIFDDSEFLNQMIIARDRLLEQRRDLLDMAHDPEIDDQVRVNAHHLIAEISAAILRLYESGPGLLEKRHQFPRNSLVGPGTTGLRLKLNDQQLPLGKRKLMTVREEKEQEETMMRTE